MNNALGLQMDGFRRAIFIFLAMHVKHNPEIGNQRKIIFDKINMNFYEILISFHRGIF